jgi:hypothetical protein
MKRRILFAFALCITLLGAGLGCGKSGSNQSGGDDTRPKLQERPAPGLGDPGTTGAGTKKPGTGNSPAVQ